MKRVTKAVIPAAGLSSRMYPFTKIESKLLVPVINKPVVEYILEELAASGIKEVVIVSNHTEKIKQLFEEDERLVKLLKRLKRDNLIKMLHHVEHLVKVDVMRQELPMGWMHEVLHAKEYLKDAPFVVCFSDILYRSNVPAAKQVIQAFNKTGKNIRAEARFLLKPSVFKILEKEHFQLGKDLVDVDVFDKLSEANDLFNAHIEGRFYNTGDPLSYLKTQTVFGMHDPEIGEAYIQFIEGLQLR